MIVFVKKLIHFSDIIFFVELSQNSYNIIQSNGKNISNNHVVKVNPIIYGTTNSTKILRQNNLKSENKSKNL